MFECANHYSEERLQSSGVSNNRRRYKRRGGRSSCPSMLAAIAAINDDENDIRSSSPMALRRSQESTEKRKTMTTDRVPSMSLSLLKLNLSSANANTSTEAVFDTIASKLLSEALSVLDIESHSSSTDCNNFIKKSSTHCLSTHIPDCLLMLPEESENNVFLPITSPRNDSDTALKIVRQALTLTRGIDYE